MPTMRSIWKGAISFGLVTIPVKLYSATQARDVTFHQVHAEDGGRIKYKRTCSIDGEEVPYSDIAKGYELPSGQTVVLTDDDFADLPLTSSKTIDVLEFVEASEVDPIYFEKSYYLEPEKTGVRPYVLLREALEQSGRVAVVKVALRSREALATLRVRGGVFVLETMIWPDEVREPEFGFLDEDIEVRPQELTMAASLIETLAGSFDPSQYSDSYREALEELIEAKVAGQEVVAPTATTPTVRHRRRPDGRPAGQRRGRPGRSYRWAAAADARPALRRRRPRQRRKPPRRRLRQRKLLPRRPPPRRPRRRSRPAVPHDVSERVAHLWRTGAQGRSPRRRS